MTAAASCVPAYAGPEGISENTLASVFALIPSGPGYAGTQDAAAVTGILALGGTHSQAVTYVILVRFVIAVPITIAGWCGRGRSRKRKTTTSSASVMQAM